MGEDYDFDDTVEDADEISHISIGATEARRDCRRTIEALREERELRRLLDDDLDY